MEECLISEDRNVGHGSSSAAVDLLTLLSTLQEPVRHPDRQSATHLAIAISCHSALAQAMLFQSLLEARAVAADLRQREQLRLVSADSARDVPNEVPRLRQALADSALNSRQVSTNVQRWEQAMPCMRHHCLSYDLV